MKILTAQEARELSCHYDFISDFNRRITNAALDGESYCVVPFPATADDNLVEAFLAEVIEADFTAAFYYQHSGDFSPSGVVVCWDNDPATLQLAYEENDIYEE